MYRGRYRDRERERNRDTKRYHERRREKIIKDKKGIGERKIGAEI